MSLFDKGLVRMYHLITFHETLFFDPNGSFVTPLLWLKNKDGKPKRILLYPLTTKHPAGKTPPIALTEHLISDHNITSIRTQENCS